MDLGGLGNRHAGGFFSLQSCTGLHCMEFARSPIRGDEGFQPWATSHRAAVCNPDCNHIWKNLDRNGQIALPRHCAIFHSHQLKFPHSLTNLSVWSTAGGSLVGGGPGTAHFPSQARLSLSLFRYIWMSFPWELIVQILGRLLRISRCFYVSILANDLWDELQTIWLFFSLVNFFA